MSGYYLWLKALHVAFMVTWFVGLFYLPRLFIYHAEAADETGQGSNAAGDGECESGRGAGGFGSTGR